MPVELPRVCVDPFSESMEIGRNSNSNALALRETAIFERIAFQKRTKYAPNAATRKAGSHQGKQREMDAALTPFVSAVAEPGVKR